MSTCIHRCMWKPGIDIGYLYLLVSTFFMIFNFYYYCVHVVCRGVYTFRCHRTMFGCLSSSSTVGSGIKLSSLLVTVLLQ